MKICIDGIGISLLQGTGLYTYTYELLDNLFESYPQPGYEIICDREVDISKWSANKKIYWLNIQENKTENRERLIEGHISEHKINIFHSPNNGLRLPMKEHKDNKCKYVITVHDVISASNSNLVDGKYLNRFQKVFPDSIDKADRIVAVSEFIKYEIIKYFNVPEKKIEVIYPGCGERFKHMEADESREFLKNTYNIEGDIILYAGSMHIRKNLKRLINVFKYISNQDRDIKLVIAGKNDGKRYEHYVELKQYAKSLGLQDKVYFTGTVEYKDMPYLYNAAKCVVNLSDYEGFPLSSIEALSCGTPVVCSNTEVFKETISRNAIMVDTRSEKEIREAVLGVISDKSYRAEVLENSTKIKDKFRWDKVIRKYVRLYESLVLGE